MYSFVMLMVHEGKKGNASHLIAKKPFLSGFQLGKYRCSTLLNSSVRKCKRFYLAAKEGSNYQVRLKKNVTFPIAQPVMLAFIQTCLSCTCWVVVKELVCNYKGVNFSIACTFSFY